MPYQTFDPAGGCSPLLPLNAVVHRLGFYQVLLLEMPLSELAASSGLPAAYSRMAPGGDVAGQQMRVGLPLTTLHPVLRAKYRDVRTPDLRGKRLPVQLGIEGVFLPVDPAAKPDPLPQEQTVTSAQVVAGKVRVGKSTVTLTAQEQRRLAETGSLLVNAGAGQVRLRLAAATPPKKTAAARTFSAAGRRLTVADLAGHTTDEFPDATYEQVLAALLADPRSGYGGFVATPELAALVAGLADAVFRALLLNFTRDPRYLRFQLDRAGHGPRKLIPRPRLPRYDIALFSSYEQAWTLQGYSRGALLNSLTLAPEEELTIEVLTFDRRRVEEERIESSELQRNSEISAMSNVVSSIARELSEQNQMTGEIGLGLPLPAGGVPVNVEAGGSSSSDVKATMQASLEQLTEVTRRVSEQIKSVRQVKVVEARETGREDRVTRRIRNTNQGHAMTLNCFEVLETFQVETRLKDAKRFCLLVELPDLGPVDVPFVLAYQDRLQAALLSKVYLDGFDAAKVLHAQGWFDHASLQKAEIEEASRQSVAATAAPAQVKPVVQVARQLKAALEKIYGADLLEAAAVLAEHYDPFDGKDVSKREKAEAEAAVGLFNYAFKLNLVSPGMEDRARTFLDAMRRDGSEAAVVEALGAFLAGADDEWVTHIKMAAASLVSANLAAVLAIPFPVLVPVFLSLAVIENNAGYPGLVGRAKQALKAHEVAATVVAPAPGASPSADLKDREPPPQLYSLQELAEARARFDALRLHIEANRVYYMNQVWRAEDPEARYERFRQAGVHTFVENQLLGFVGSRAIHPLRLSALEPVVREQLQERLLRFDPAAAETFGTGRQARAIGPVQVGVQTISLPTSAVYMDGGLGQCELLEPYLKQRRDIERRIAQADADLAELRVQEARAKLATPPHPAP